MSSSADTEVAFGKPKKRAGRPRQREAGSAGGAWKEEESGENVAADTLSPADAPTPLPASSFPAKVKSTNQTVLNFDTTGDDDDTNFQLKKKDGKGRKKKPSIFDDSVSSFQRAAEPVAADQYSHDSLEQLKRENQMQFVVKPLTKAEKAQLDQDDSLLRVLDATAIIEPQSQNGMDVTTTEIIPDEEEADDFFDSKQAEAARAMRLRLQRDHALRREAEHDEFDDTVHRNGQEMEVDEEAEADGDRSSAEDDEEAERRALGVAFSGRHKFADATTKPKQTGMEYVREQMGQQAQEGNMFADFGADDYEWELELIKRSGIKRSHQTSASDKAAATMAHGSSQSRAPKRIENVEIPERTMEPSKEDDIIKKLEADMAQLRSVSSTHEQRLQQIRSAKTEHEASFATADSSFAQASEDLRYFEDLKIYMLDLIDCVEDKLHVIGEVDERMFQAKLRRVRRTQTFLKSAFQEEFERTKKNPTVSPPDGAKWSTFRAKQRARHSQEDKLPFSFDSPHFETYDGYSSDEETTQEDEQAYVEALEPIRQAAVDVFSDAREEYCRLDVILARIGDFRSKYAVSYGHAHVSSDLPQLLAPLVRLEVVPWNPLKNPKFYEWPWFDVVDQFSQAAPTTEDNQPRPPFDADLTAAIAADVLVPLVKNSLNYFWRPNSLVETQVLQELLGNLRHVLPQKSLAEILVQVHLNLVNALTSFDLPKTLPKPAPGNVASAIDDYADIAFMRAIKLLHIILTWRPYFAPTTIETLLFETLIGAKLLPYLKALSLVACWTKLRLLVAALGTVLSGPQHANARRSLEAFMKEKEDEALGHYEASELAASVFAYIDSLVRLAQ